MKKNRKDSFRKNRRVANTFKHLWTFINNDSSIQRKIVSNISSGYTIDQKNDYFQQVPLFQEFLTQKDMICRDKIEYSNFVQSPPDKINSKNIYECFHGILMYIFYYSGNKLNIGEIEFHFTGGKNRKDLFQIMKQNALNGLDQWNILNIFQYENIGNQFLVDSAADAFFGVTFKRIKVNPICYSIRSDSSNFSHLISFAFEGYDEDNLSWDILDERVNINDLIPSGGFSLFYVRSTTKSYSSFRIRQIEPGSNGFWGFSIAAFDIHGIITLQENLSLNDNLLGEQSCSTDLFGNDFDNFNPNMDMTDYLY